MNYSLKDQLKVVAPRLSADLVSTEALSHIYTLAQILPPLSNALLECRLGASASRLDLSVPLPNSATNLPDSILIHPLIGSRSTGDICSMYSCINCSSLWPTIL